MAGLLTYQYSWRPHPDCSPPALLPRSTNRQSLDRTGFDGPVQYQRYPLDVTDVELTVRPSMAFMVAMAFLVVEGDATSRAISPKCFPTRDALLFPLLHQIIFRSTPRRFHSTMKVSHFSFQRESDLQLSIRDLVLKHLKLS